MCSRDPQTLNLRHWCLLSPKYSSSKQSTKVVARRIIFFRCRAGKSPLLCRIDSNLVTLLLLRPVCLYWSFIIIIKATGKQINLLLFHCCVWWLLFFFDFLILSILWVILRLYFAQLRRERAAGARRMGKIKEKITTNINTTTSTTRQHHNPTTITTQLERRRHNEDRLQQYL